ncbi:Ig-like domain-containing protein [Anaeromyxobacter sp. Fw109-5]|uniref:Ig-like domain-containing protein n=1 Tax=Anaeromyxobacter sp. (strain Fw109-5) TaxID=404589 RepID=UPI0000ED8A1F|nr:Ig-like domain-containing protein [Anaeromyxobacter sp. Fw109-5]ABS27525.1 Ig domain protein group 2 domain protein [Anaeromyxobacter sp. Fw109-5]
MRRISALGLVAVLAAACSGGGGGDKAGGPGPAATLVSIAVTPATAVTVPGATVKLTATGAYDDGGTRDVTAEASWSSLNGAVAQVSAGVVTGVTAGTATVSAAIGAVQGTALVTVDTPTFVSVRVDPPSATISTGQSLPIRCLGTTDRGLEIDVTAAAVWTSVDPLVATVARGVVSGVKVGGTDVRATYAGLSSQAHVTVEAASLASLLLGAPPTLTLAAGDWLDVHAFAVYTDGSLRDVTLLAEWSSSAPPVAEVSSVAESAGRILTLAPGASTIGASFGGKAASTELTVLADSVIFLLVEPVPSPLPVGGAHRLRATALHADGTSADVTGLATWSSDSTTVAVDAASGVATLVAGGVATVTASYGGAVGRGAVTVTGDAPTALELDATAIAMGLGDYTWPPPHVRLRYANGATYDVSSAAELSVPDPAVALVETGWSDDTVVRAVGLGSTTMQARYAGLSVTATVQVTAPLSFALDAPASVPAGVSWRVKAQTRVQGKYVVETEDVSRYAEWSSSAPAVIAVSNAPDTKGTATVVGAGTATLTAAFGGMTATKTITVLGPLSAITISPAPLLVPSGETRQLSATARLADGRTTDATTLVTWRCDRVIGSVHDGSFWSSGPGTGEITAAIGDVFGTVTATVVREPGFGGLAIRPALQYGSERLPVGHTGQFRAVYVYSVGGQDVEVPVDREVAWSTSAASIAAFDDPAHPGRVHALAAGNVYLRAETTSPAGAPMQASMSLGVVAPTGPPTLAPVTVPLGGSAPLRLSVPLATSTATASAFATFESSDPSVLEVRGTTVVARKLGSVELRARLGEVTVAAQGTVLPVTAKALYVALPYELTVGAKAKPGAFVELDSGDYVDVTQLATWACSTPAVATLTWTPGTMPELLPIAAGTATVEASWSGFVAADSATAVGGAAEPQLASLTFEHPSYELPVGGTLSMQLRGTLPSGGAATVTGARVTISPADVAGLEVSGSYGVVTGLKVGSAVVTAAWGGQTATAVVNVTHAIGEFGIYPQDSGPYGVHPHELLGFNAFENPTFAVFEDALAWASSNPAVLKVVAPGVVEGVAPGKAVVTAASGLQVWPWVVTVSSAPLERLELDGIAPTVPAGTSYRFRAIARWADGASGDVTNAATWWSADPTVVEFDPAAPGKLVTKRAGTVRIEARIDGVTESAEVTVF